MAEDKLVPAVERASRILDFVSASATAPGAAEIGREIGLAKSSAHGLLATLVSLGLLTRRGDGSYAIGPHVARWGAAFERQADVSAEFARLWDEGAPEPGATITLSVLDGAEVVYVGARNSGRTPWVDFRVGMRLPAAFTATGMAMLAAMTNAEARMVLGDALPAPLTPRSARTVDEALARIAQARAAGHSLDAEQVRLGMSCIGAPVLGAEGRPLAAVAVSVPTEELTAAEEARLAAALSQVAQALSRRMGGG